MALRQQTQHDGGNIALMKRQRRKKPLAWWISAGLLAAFAGAILWFAWTAGLFVSDKVKTPQIKVTMLDKHTILVRNTDISGLDASNQPFTVHARISKRPDASKNTIYLTGVSGDMKKNNGETITFRSDKAVYYRKEQLVDLIDHVRIESKGRYILKTSKARVNVRTKEITSHEPVLVTLADGVIRAKGVRAGQNADRVFFPGRVHATFGTGKGARERADRRNN
jgi:LPS export ABC transporter protein LptC